MAAAQEVAQRYIGELQATVQSIQKKSTEVSERAQKAVKDWSAYLKEKGPKTLIDEAKTTATSALSDQSPLDEDDNAFVCDTFLWLAVCFVGLTVGQMVGSVTSGALGLTMGPLEAVLITFVGLPACFAHYHSTKRDELVDEQRRLNSLAFSVLLGILAGIQLAGIGLTFIAPPAFAVHLAIGFVAGALRSSNRLQLVGASLSGSMAVYTIWSFVVGGGLSCILWALVICGLAAVDLQVKIAQRRAGSVDVAKHHLQTILGYVVVQSVLTLVLGTSATATTEKQGRPAPIAK